MGTGMACGTGQQPIICQSSAAKRCAGRGCALVRQLANSMTHRYAVTLTHALHGKGSICCGNCERTSHIIISRYGFEIFVYINCTLPHRWWTTLAWQWGLWAPRVLLIPLFRNPKGRRLLRVPQFGPQNPAYGGAKISGDPFRACVRRVFWWYHYLRAFSEADTGTPGINSDWCIVLTQHKLVGEHCSWPTAADLTLRQTSVFQLL